MSRLKVAVMGAGGRMGQEVIQILKSASDLEFVAGVDHSNKEFLKTPDQLKPNEVDIVIDFSLPEGFANIASWCLKSNKPLVSGTTGVSEADQEVLQQLAKKVPCLWAPNMSIGVAIVTEMLKNFAAIKDFDFAIEEMHHSQKKDKPSGTAQHLRAQLETVIDKKTDDPAVVRGGGIFGVHRILAMSEEEVITLEHTALNRSVFAKGAVRAAQWLYTQPPGRYHIKDMVQI